MNDSSSALTSVKKTRSLDNIFVFKEPEKEFKEDSTRSLFIMRDFTSLKRIKKGLRPLILSFESMTKVSQ